MSKKIAKSLSEESNVQPGASVLARILASNESVDLIVGKDIRNAVMEHISRLSTSGNSDDAELLGKLKDPNSSESAELLQQIRSRYLSHEMKERIREGFGNAKANLVYNYMYKRLTSVDRQFTLGLAMCKLAHQGEASDAVSRLSSADFVAFVDLVDGICNIPEITEKEASLRQSRREHAYAASQASLPEKLLKQFLPDASRGNITSVMMSFIKEKMSFGGKENKHTDDICMDLLLASPFNNFAMFFAASVTGSLGLMVMTLPLYVAWTALSSLKSVVTVRSDIADVNNPTTGTQFTKLLTDSDRTSPLLIRQTSDVPKSGFANKEEYKKRNSVRKLAENTTSNHADYFSAHNKTARLSAERHR